MISLLANLCILCVVLLRLGSCCDSASLLKSCVASSSIFHGVMKELTEARQS